MTTTQTKSKILSDNWALKMFIWAAGNIAFQKARNNINKGKDVLIAAAIGGTAGILEDICSNTINHGKGFGSGVVSGALSGLALASYSAIKGEDNVRRNALLISSGCALLDGSIRALSTEQQKEDYLSDDTKNKKNNKNNKKSDNNIIDPHKLLCQSGVVKVRIAYTNVVRPDFETKGSYTCTCYSGFKNKLSETAFNLFSQIPIVQNAFKLFDSENKNKLIFQEHDADWSGTYAKTNFYLRTKDTFNYNEYAIDEKNLRFKNYFLKNADKYSAGIDVKFYPAQLYDFNESMKVAYLAIALGHELFIHDTNLKIVSLWNQSRYEEAWNLAVAKLTQKTDDHTMYMAGNKPQMNNYITQLKSFVRKNGSKFNVTEQDIKTAVELHNKTYKR